MALQDKRVSSEVTLSVMYERSQEGWYRGSSVQPPVWKRPISKIKLVLFPGSLFFPGIPAWGGSVTASPHRTALSRALFAGNHAS